MQRPTGRSYIPTLDGWRAIAIVGVLLCHASDRGSVFQLGELGVTLYFGVFGFLITDRMVRELTPSRGSTVLVRSDGVAEHWPD